MATPPKNIEDSIKSDPKAAINAELASVKSDQAGSSWLRQAIDYVTEPYHHQSASAKKLEQAADEINRQGNSILNKGIAAQAIREMESARQGETDSYKIVSGAAKTAATFIPGKYGYLTAGAVYALDSTGGGGTGTSDAIWGMAKGMFMRGAVSQLSKGSDGPAMMSLKLGLATRVIDTSLTPSNFVGKDGEVTWGSFGSSIVKTGKVSLDPISLGTDIATAGIAQGVLKIAPKALAGNTFRAMTTMTFTRGYASGLAEELQQEHHQGQYSLSRLAAYPLATALSQTIAAAPGNQSLQARKWPLENALAIREQEFRLVSVTAADVKAIARGGGKPVETTVRPIGEDLVLGQPVQLSIGKANIPTDWIAAAMKSMKPTKPLPEEQWRFVSRPKGDESAPWQMALNHGTTPVSQLIKQSTQSYYQGKSTGPKLANLVEPATKFLGSGSESGAFQLANGTVLKVSSSHSPEKVQDWGKLPYDAKTPFEPLVFGKVPNPYNAKIISTASSILLQEPLRTPISEARVEQLRKDMDAARVSFWDYNYHLMGDQVSWATEQAGIDATGKAVMLDYGARRPYYNWSGTAEPAAKPQSQPVLEHSASVDKSQPSTPELKVSASN